MRVFIVVLMVCFYSIQPLFAVEVKSIDEINRENALPLEPGEKPPELDQSQVESIDEINRENALPLEPDEKPPELDQSQVESIDEINRENELRD